MPSIFKRYLGAVGTAGPVKIQFSLPILENYRKNSAKNFSFNPANFVPSTMNCVPHNVIMPKLVPQTLLIKRIG